MCGFTDCLTALLLASSVKKQPTAVAETRWIKTVNDKIGGDKNENKDGTDLVSISPLTC